MAETPATEEKQKESKRGQDAAYTINHAIACTATDFGAPFISHGVAKRIFHTHSNLKGWFLGEGVGDILAVPVTIALEHAAPRMTGGIRKGMESSLGWAFRKSARREAQSWATGQGLGKNSAEAKAKEQEIYRYEIEHLPQAAIWTATSMALNIATQKAFHKQLHGAHGHDHDHEAESILKMTGALFVGKAVSTGAVIGARAAFPDKAHRWDNFAARTVFDPLSNAADKALRRKKKTDWSSRTEKQYTATQAAAR